jgi:hypothetical protein
VTVSYSAMGTPMELEAPVGMDAALAADEG